MMPTYQGVRKRWRRVVKRTTQSRRTLRWFHRLYYDEGLTRGTWGATSWLGVPVQKLPLDLWIYQEVVCETAPELVVETGTASGGSALFLVLPSIWSGAVASSRLISRSEPIGRRTSGSGTYTGLRPHRR